VPLTLSPVVSHPTRLSVGNLAVPPGTQHTKGHGRNCIRPWLFLYSVATHSPSAAFRKAGVSVLVTLKNFSTAIVSDDSHSTVSSTLRPNSRIKSAGTVMLRLARPVFISLRFLCILSIVPYFYFGVQPTCC